MANNSDIMVREPKHHQTMVRTPISMWQKILKESDALGISAMEWIRRAIQEKLDNATLDEKENQFFKETVLEKDRIIQQQERIINTLQDHIQLISNQSLSQQIEVKGLRNQNISIKAERKNADNPCDHSDE